METPDQNQEPERGHSSLVDRWLRNVKNHPFFAGIIILAIVISGTAQFIGGVSQLIDATHKLLSKLGFLEERVQHAEITGIWESPTYGLMQLEQQGNNVAGTYGPYTRQHVGLIYGALKGEIEGKRLDFTWCQDTSKELQCENAEWQGDGYFILSYDGKSLEGEWRFKDDKEWRAPWTLRRR